MAKINGPVQLYLMWEPLFLFCTFSRQTPVILAAERGLYEVVRVLSEHGATDVNLQDSFGRTALHWWGKVG